MEGNLDTVVGDYINTKKTTFLLKGTVKEK